MDALKYWKCYENVTSLWGCVAFWCAFHCWYEAFFPWLSCLCLCVQLRLTRSRSGSVCLLSKKNTSQILFAAGLKKNQWVCFSHSYTHARSHLRMHTRTNLWLWFGGLFVLWSDQGNEWEFTQLSLLDILLFSLNYSIVSATQNGHSLYVINTYSLQRALRKAICPFSFPNTPGKERIYLYVNLWGSSLT